MDFDTIPAVPPIPKQARHHSRQRSLHKAVGRVDSTSSLYKPQHSSKSNNNINNTPPIPQQQPPPIPPQPKSHSQFHTPQPPSSSRNHEHGLVAPASHEVLNNLIDSFAVIQKPSSPDSDIPPHPTRPSPPPPIPNFPFSSPIRERDRDRSSPYSYSRESSRERGSFGVDYGAFHQPSIEDLRASIHESLDDLAAAPPVIKTSKPPSGYSSLTAPRSLSHRDSSGGLRSLLRPSSSRPSSKGSSCSREDTQSIGNISIDRAGARSPELRRSRSTESWGTKPNRNQKGLMYMSSKERLREKEYERKRASIGSAGANASILEHSSSPLLRPSAPLAEIPITEEQISPVDALSPETRRYRSQTPVPVTSAMSDMSSPRQIPARDSSLRKTGGGGGGGGGSTVRRSSTRKSHSSKRDSSSGCPSDGHMIPEGGEVRRLRTEISTERGSERRQHRRGNSSMDAGMFRRAAPDFYYSNDQQTTVTVAGGSSSVRIPLNRRVSDGYRPSQQTVIEDDRYRGLAITTDEVDFDDDSAPFPAVAQGRRRDHSAERSSKRRSGRYSSDALEGVKIKRSSSRLKRLSGSNNNSSINRATSPMPDEKKRASQVTSPEPASILNGYERPQSADSIDDAVEAYLCSPRLTQKIRHPQTGRVISFSEVGDSEGYAVFCCVGMGLTRYITAFYDELALTLKLRLITPDRPGVGESEAYNDGTTTPLSWPDDVYAICQTLKISKFSILAHSAGAIYALATALRMPQHIRGRIHLLAPWIPPSQMNVFGTSQALPPTNAIPTSQRILRALPTPFLKAANSSFMTATSSSITSSLPKTPRRKQRKVASHKAAMLAAASSSSQDKENMGFAATSGDVDRPVTQDLPENMDRVKPGLSSAGSSYKPDAKVLTAAFDALADKERQQLYDERLTHAIWELATTGANPAVDLLVCLERRHTIGFRYVDITRPVVIHHGSRDTRVPVDNVRWLGKTMRRCEVRVLEGESHGLMASATVMGSVLMEIAKEWDDLARATVSSSSSGRVVR